MSGEKHGAGRTFSDAKAQAAYDLFFREGWMRGDIDRFYKQGFSGVSQPEAGGTPRAAVWWAGHDRAAAGLPFAKATAADAQPPMKGEG